MDELTRVLISANRRMRAALTAIRDGHQASVDFLAESGTGYDPPLPQSLSEAIRLASTCADMALDGSDSESAETYEFSNLLLRRILLQYGSHDSDCPAEFHASEPGDCNCSWWGVRAKLIADLSPTPTVEEE